MTLRGGISIAAVILGTALAGCSSGGSSSTPGPNPVDLGGGGGGGATGPTISELRTLEEDLYQDLGELEVVTGGVLPTTGSATYDGVLTVFMQDEQSLTGAMSLSVAFDPGSVIPISGTADNFFYNDDAFNTPAGPVTEAEGRLSIFGSPIQPDNSSTGTPTAILEFNGTVTTTGGTDFDITGESTAQFFGPQSDYIVGAGAFEVSADGGPAEFAIPSYILAAE